MSVNLRARRGRLAVVAAAASVSLAVPALALAGDANRDRSGEVRRAVEASMSADQARNVILLIGDGMGDSEITLARNYAVGAAGRLAMDRLPLTGAMTTWAVQKDAPNRPEYVTDSAAAGTAWATGRKSYNGAISVDPQDRDLPTILEQAQRAGYRTGDVTTAELTDATPAVLAAHVAYRQCQGPADMARCPADRKSAGGAGSIAEQMVQTKVDVLLGGGQQRFAQTVTEGPYAGRTVVDQARDTGYRYVTDRAGLQAARPGEKVLGLFASGNLPTPWQSFYATKTGTPPTRCTETNPERPASMPLLGEMTQRAIELLSAGKAGDDSGNRAGAGDDRGKGFFLQVEAASIDKRDHASDVCGQLGEHLEFDRAVQAALDFAAKDRKTLVVVTADHAHTSQIIPTYQKAPGNSATLITADGATMQVTYGTGVAGQSHTGAQVRIAALGPQAANVVGLTDNTDLYWTLARALGVARGERGGEDRRDG
ncbi:MAG: alkaline phosphatase [Actinomycetota bacterium]